MIATLDKRALELQLEQAVAGVSAAKAAVTQAKNDGTDAEVKAAKARLDAGAGGRRSWRRCSWATPIVTAPQAGVVSAVAANAGQNASPGKTIATISDTNDLFVRVFVPETRIGDVKLGAAATVETDSSDATYPGTVEFIASQAEFTPNNVETKEQRVKLVYEVRRPPQRHERRAQGRHARGRDVLACPSATDTPRHRRAARCAAPSATCSPSTASTWPCARARSSGCSARTAPASRR